MTPRNPDAKRWRRIQKGAAITASVCIVLLGLTRCEPSVKTVARITDQTKLSRIAVEAKSDFVRYAAVEKLTDQSLLAKIALEDKEWRVRSCAVWKLTDQSLLAKIALEDKEWTVRCRAVDKFTDQSLVMKFAVEAKSDYVRSHALRKLTDQSLLAKFAVENKDWYDCKVAVEKLTDQAMLAKVAVEGKDSGVCLEALEKLTDQAMLTMTAVEAKDSAIRRNAYNKLDKDRTLAELCDTAVDPATRVDASLLLKIRKTWLAAISGATTYRKFEAPSLFWDVFDIVTALTDPLVTTELGDVDDVSVSIHETTRMYGKEFDEGYAQKVTGESITVSVKLGKKGRVVSHAWSSHFPTFVGEGTKNIEAEIKIKTQEFFSDICDLLSEPGLAKVAADGKLPSFRSAAVDKLINLRKAAIGKLTDQAVLEKIATEDKDSDAKEAAGARLSQLRLEASR
jgi:hypothetical protein